MQNVIGKIIKIFALVLGVLLLAVFLGLGVACLLAAGAEDVDEVLKTAGLQAAIISFVLALLSPLFCLVLYAVGTLSCNAQKQAQELADMKALLRQALSDGMLSDEVARKVTFAQEKLIAQLQAAAPAKPSPTNAPVQRYVEEPVEQEAPAEVAQEEVSEEIEETEETVQTAETAQVEAEVTEAAEADEAEQAVEETAEGTAEEAVIPTPVAEAPVAEPLLAAPAKPVARPRAKAPKTPVTATPLRPIGADDEVF